MLAGRDQVFQLEPAVDPAALIRELAGLLPCRPLEPRAETLLALDTFDGRLTRARCSLRAVPRGDDTRLQLRLADEENDRSEHVRAVPDFAADLPPSFRELLAPRLEMRRLLVVLEVDAREHGLDVLDEERKTVARLRLVTAAARRVALPCRDGAPPPEHRVELPALLVASAVRGYAAELPPLLSVLASRPGLRPAAQGPHELMLELMQAALPVVPSPSATGLHPEMPAAVALRRVHAALLAAFRAHEPGVRADLDSEFLHDFRVAVRRTRCLLGQLRRVFPAPDVERWRAELGWLGRITGPLRDLDVFLLMLADPGVAGEDTPALAPLAEELRRRQRDEHARLLAELDSPRYAELVAGWEAFLAQPAGAASEGPRGGEPIARVAGRRVARLHARIRRRGRRLEPHAPGSEFHELRIDAKKMRYVLDCTRGALDERDVAPLLAALKRLQSVLGDVQDGAVQRDLLRSTTLELAAGGGVKPETLLAVGRLEERLAARSERARASFAERLQAFAGEPLRDHARRLGSAPAEPEADG